MPQAQITLHSPYDVGGPQGKADYDSEEGHQVYLRVERGRQARDMWFLGDSQ